VAPCEGDVQAVEAGEASPALLTELHAEIGEEKAAGLRGTIQGQLTVTGELLKRRIAEAWVEAGRHDANRTEV